MLECPEAVGEVVPEDHYGVHSGNYAACHLAPARPGFGLSLDSDFFAEAVKRGGGEINLQKTQ